LIFGGPTLEFPATGRNYGETRVGADGEAGGIVLFVVYTRRGEAHRLISARKAGTDERQAYFARIAAADSDEAGRN